MTASFRKATLLKRLAREAILPVVVLEDASHAEPLAAALAAGGCGLVEITLRTAASLPAIKAIAAHPTMMVGAGTVLSADQVIAAHAAGAGFIVSPGLDPAVVTQAQALKLPVLPGISTATELQAARALGLRLVKFFPANIAGGAAAIRALAAVFRDMQFMPTGGIDASNLSDYLAVPAVIACGGSWLAAPELIAAGNFPEITRRTAAALAIAQAARPKREES